MQFSKWSLALLTLSAHVQLIAVTLTATCPFTENAGTVNTGGSFTVGTLSGDLRGCLNYINSQASGATYDIQFSGAGAITLANMLPVINLYGSNTVTFNSNAASVTLDGANTYNGLFVRQGIVCRWIF